MFAVLTMDVASDDIIDVPGVRYRNVFATDAVHVIERMRIARVARVAARQIVFSKLVLVDVIAVRMMEMPVVHVIHVIFMANGEMAACGTVKVVVAIVNVRFHGRTSALGRTSVPPLGSRGQRAARPPFAEQPEQIP